MTHNDLTPSLSHSLLLCFDNSAPTFSFSFLFFFFSCNVLTTISLSTIHFVKRESATLCVCTESDNSTYYVWAQGLVQMKIFLFLFFVLVFVACAFNAGKQSMSILNLLIYECISSISSMLLASAIYLFFASLIENFDFDSCSGIFHCSHRLLKFVICKVFLQK